MIQSIARAVDILDMLAEYTPETVSASTLAQRLNLSPQTVGNILRELYSLGLVSQDSSRKYRLGSHCFFLGQAADHWQTLRNASNPILKELRDATKSTVFLGVVENDRLLCLSILNPEDEFFSLPPQLWMDQLHATACGRLLVALMPAEERRRLFKRIARRQITQKTVTDVDTLNSLCKEIAEKQYAEVQDESVEGTWSLAVPVRSMTGELIAGLALSNRMAAYDDTPLETRLELMMGAAARIGVAACFNHRG
ncbi:MAG: IclR family transcriptional regulator [Oligosphaeraceae bacterium]